MTDWKKRIFGGKKFNWNGNQKYKSDAVKSASFWRKKGYNVRVVKDKRKGNSQGFGAGETIYRIFLRKK